MGTTHPELTVTQECPSAHRLVHTPALLSRRHHHIALLCLSWACITPVRCCWAARVSGDERQGHGGQSLPAPSSLSFMLILPHSSLARPLSKESKRKPEPPLSPSSLQHTSQCCWMRQNLGLQVTIILHIAHC